MVAVQVLQRYSALRGVAEGSMRLTFCCRCEGDEGLRYGLGRYRGEVHVLRDGLRGGEVLVVVVGGG